LTQFFQLLFVRSIAHNTFGPEGVRHLADALRGNSTLQTLE
jgi:hypothetical protein